jgi:hypothetical protein
LYAALPVYFSTNVGRYVSGCDRNGARKLTFDPALARVTSRRADHVFAG